ncbi:MAG: hypothetical protein HC888_11675 [Candidatus Competibacteraceae bacterium]|nr:hypothetical protein [Candidatus Competibacteraceae bacterium]
MHAKDTALTTSLTLRLDEVRPGAGRLDYPVLLREIERVDRDMPLIIEHLKTDEDYALGAKFIRETAAALDVKL